jgi:hypothetical protein
MMKGLDFYNFTWSAQQKPPNQASQSFAAVPELSHGETQRPYWPHTPYDIFVLHPILTIEGSQKFST